MTLPGTATQYRIREATESELDAVGRLTYEGFGHHLPGASGLVLDTGADNERSQQLYRRFGFVRWPERERPLPAPKVQLVVYTLDLAGYQAA